MKTRLISFLAIFIFCSCTNTKSDNINMKTMGKDTINLEPSAGRNTFSESESDCCYPNDFEVKKEYYFQILLSKWLKGVSRQELKAVRSESEYNALMGYGKETRDSTSKILEENYNIVETSTSTSSMGGIDYPFMIARANQLVWVLFSRTSRRATWCIEDSAWIAVKENLMELRDNNTYTFFLRNVEFGIKDQCLFLRKPRKIGTFSNGVDSVTALSIAISAAEECYREGNMAPLAAKLMGNNQEHWLVYTFEVIPDEKEQKNILRIFTLRHKEGLSLWGMSTYPCYDNLELIPFEERCSHSYSRVVTALISRETGEVLFIN